MFIQIHTKGNRLEEIVNLNYVVEIRKEPDGRACIVLVDRDVSIGVDEMYDDLLWLLEASGICVQIGCLTKGQTP